MRALLSIAIVGSIGACDVVFGIDHLKDPSGSGGEIDGGIPVDAPLERYYVQSKAEAIANGARLTSTTVKLGNVFSGDVLLVAVCTLKGNPITNVSDTQGNVYRSLGPAATAELQADLFITDLPLTSNLFSVIVKYEGSGAVNPDVRVAEYRHLVIPPLGAMADTRAMEGVSQLSATVHGVTAPSLLFAANCMKTYTLDIPGFTSREQPAVNGDRIADQNVDAAGDYSATTLGSGSAAIIMTLASVPALP